MSGEQKGALMYRLAEKLFPICRSITGDGVRESLSIIQEYIPLEIHEVPSGTAVFDWTVPPEWNIRDAWVKGPDGKKIIDFKANNLHILQYSTPIHQILELEDLKKHLFTLPDQPDLIPYRTSYYQQNWGFCLAYRELQRLPEGQYEVYIDASLEEGHLTYGELYLPGESTNEVLLSAHICHPALANDNLSGISVLTFLAQWLLGQKNRYSYRFLFIPGTIGSITWLALNEPKVQNIQHGLVASLLGDAGGFTYKRSRRGDAEIDKVAEYVLKHSGQPYQVFDFFPYGYDERQFCSPGFNLPVGNLTRSSFGTYPEYHTSGDNLQFIQDKYLAESLDIYQQIITILEHNVYCQNLNPKCEPQLGKRGLYDAIGGDSDQKKLQMAMLWVLNFSDGTMSLLDIAERAKLPFNLILKTSKLLIKYELLV
ncbi:Protein of unknown function DUF2172, aminopeptidase [Haliscomenobacter hydrossis DSM 1100]|uniref:Peptidase M28 n=2 Tax=Haliscomenobacter TaxID=2349 RepID=F4KR41_HALH1|nr:Protein of unknown function DUF2172, aminopeptidase [Haliscomenobacter hydrossis DSM 1100]